MFVLTFTGVVYVIQRNFNFINVKRTVTSSLQSLGIVSLNNVVYVSAHDDNGRIYKLIPLIMTMVAWLRR